MNMFVYTVLDRAVGAYLPPFFCRSKGEAIRSFSDAVNDEKHHFHKHIDDFSLWCIGSWSDASGVIETGEPVRVVTALEVLVPDDPFSPGARAPDLGDQVA